MFRPEYGYIEMVVGPMFSGKSEELIRRVKRAVIAEKNVMVFKPGIDKRYSITDVASHSGQKLKAIPVNSSEDIKEKIEKYKKEKGEKPFLVGIDEVQFLDEKIVDLAEDLANDGIIVVMSGLDQDFKGEPFKITADLMAKAEFITKLQAVCVKCGRPATKSQRIINGKPARIDDEVILVGAKESYEPRCRRCHEILKGEN